VSGREGEEVRGNDFCRQVVVGGDISRNVEIGEKGVERGEVTAME
jgi:hypothetical protein